MKKRIDKLIAQFDSLGIDCFIVSNARSVRYLSGFTGSNGLCMIAEDERYFITDFRYQEQVKEEVRDFDILISREYLFDELKEKNLIKGRKAGFEAKRITFFDYQKLLAFIPSENFIPVNDLIDKLVSVKDDEEIENIKKASEIGDKIFNEIIPMIKSGIEEIEISAEISYRIKKYGGEKDAFDPIVLSGTKSALPHGRPDKNRLKLGEFVLLDFGCVYNGYHSDMTRTVFLGKPNKKEYEIYSTVLEAQKNAVKSVREGMSCSELDSVARNFIAEKGFSQYFGHSLGHGLGLEIHETPKISQLNHETLVSRNVITIEPGIYIPNYGGVRIEDDVVVQPNGCIVLTNSPKELICV